MSLTQKLGKRGRFAKVSSIEEGKKLKRSVLTISEFTNLRKNSVLNAAVIMPLVEFAPEKTLNMKTGRGEK